LEQPDIYPGSAAVFRELLVMDREHNMLVNPDGHHFAS
jgi:hypothetical protein